MKTKNIICFGFGQVAKNFIKKLNDQDIPFKLTTTSREESRNKKFQTIKVNTVSLNDLIKNEFNDVSPSYISVDTEGSEYEILKNFNFSKYNPIILTI